MIYIVLLIAILITSGIIFANREVKRTRQERRKRLRRRAGRCIGSE